MEKFIRHFLGISGVVPGNKRKVFEQIFKFVFNQFPIKHSHSISVFVDARE
ncbi:hypothetical protein [Flavitalea sp.]|nr:hypothetical protein [Flavitalea sp.]